jgi:hypothetical protein
MKKVEIICDELYPSYSLREANKWSDKTVEISEERFNKIKEFQKRAIVIHNQLEKLYIKQDEGNKV